ncbi:enhanced serine sensitivity protein SseB C-terminal domain-containing protein [Floccifex sp.]|uniref:enhanced serine sensitivity protein SseB C-terminal domain-containing protein n=1 Tax=Floccifex sp. TaxID=2815810 RepID=UPI002A7625CD|nr:enhanced serine sensitivity protein SseB C-terminal domain-containing protein [Floccifex sp.]MDD7281335.1 enhanced serine sensitivity protein SseB C-terminal domain-containing protein [Erysipelotrichaceae bacterium]MDY2958920.1 enhanced serine sensitivity protein SseB C-terminal domain-containing protein [Floccifex sp.]
MAEFNNEKLRDVLRDYRQNPTQENVNRMGTTLQTASILIPSIWDKEPKVGPNGQMLFQENTQFQFAILQLKNEQKFIVAFTSYYDYKHWDTEKRFKPMVLPLTRFMKLIKNVPDDIKGIFIDPTDVKIPLDMNFLHQVEARETAQHTSMKKREFKANETLKIKEAEQAKELKQSMIRFAQNEPSIRAIYLKERLVEKEGTHWLIVVDMEQENPQMFQALGSFIHPYDENKEMEFMFASHPISQKIIENSKPVYSKNEMA